MRAPDPADVPGLRGNAGSTWGRGVLATVTLRPQVGRGPDARVTWGRGVLATVTLRPQVAGQPGRTVQPSTRQWPAPSRWRSAVKGVKVLLVKTPSGLNADSTPTVALEVVLTVPVT